MSLFFLNLIHILSQYDFWQGLLQFVEGTVYHFVISNDPFVRNERFFAYKCPEKQLT